MSKKQILALTTIFAVVILAVAFAYSPIQLTILSIDSYYLQERGTGVPGGIMQGGNWRITATTSGDEIQWVTVNDATARQYASAGSYPSDVSITGAVTVSVWQNTEPYWHIPFTKLTEDVTVHPKMTGYFDGGKAGQTVEPKKVSLWRTNLAEKELIVPFTVKMVKTAGSTLGSMETDYPGATQTTGTDGNKEYQFALSFRDIASGEQTAIINWYNPNNPSQTARMTLHFTVGSSEYDWTHDFIVVTDQNGGDITSSNTFNAFSQNVITSQLNHDENNPYSYYRYWYGGGTIYTVPDGHAHSRGAGVIPNGSPSVGTRQLMNWDDGSVAPFFVYTTPVGSSPLPVTFVIDEDYIYGTDTQTGNTDFPGWYTPVPGNTEGYTAPPQWQLHRLPVPVTTINNLDRADPTGLSIVNYLASSNPKTGVYKDYAVRENPDVWGAGCGGRVGGYSDGLGVAIPQTARAWAYTLDISTQLVDTIIVNNNYINVQIVDIQQDRTDISAQSSATVTATLKNMDNFAGEISHGFEIPPLIASSCTTTGDGGGLHFEANEQKTVTLHIVNTGNLPENVNNQQLKYRITNTAGAETDARMLTFNFLQGIGQPETQLNINCVEADTNNRLNGLIAKVYYGTRGNEYQSFSTQDGSVSFNLGYYTGAVTLIVEDPQHRYDDKKEYFNVAEGVNSKTLVFAQNQNDGNWWENMYLWIALAGVATVITLMGGIIYYKRK